MIDTQESMTAKLCSFARAYHSNYEKEKIFDDYLAYDLMGKEEYEEIGQLIEHGFQKERFDPAYSFSGKDISDVLNTFISPIPLSRASFAERELWRFAYDRGECQYVICGAGMDTFAFRNDDPKIKVFEIDHPDTQRYKLKRIRELEWNIPKNVKYVSVDFTSDHMGNELRKAGFDPKMPSFFAILGVSYYLSLSVFEETIRTIGQNSSFASKLLFDFPDDTTFGAEAAERVKILTEITAGLVLIDKHNPKK